MGFPFSMARWGFPRNMDLLRTCQVLIALVTVGALVSDPHACRPIVHIAVLVIVLPYHPLISGHNHCI